MRAEQVTYSLLSGASGLTALVGNGSAARIYPAELPQPMALPAVVITSEGGNEEPPIGAAQIGQTHVTVTIRVSGIAQTYAGCKALMEQVRLALNYQSGTIDGVAVLAILRRAIGPDVVDTSLGAWWQYQDFDVTFIE